MIKISFSDVFAHEKISKVLNNKVHNNKKETNNKEKSIEFHVEKNVDQHSGASGTHVSPLPSVEKTSPMGAR